MPECNSAAKREMGTMMDRLILPRLDNDTPKVPFNFDHRTLLAVPQLRLQSGEPVRLLPIA